MADKPDGIGLIADLLDACARLFDGPLTFPLFILMFATIWIVSGCYGILWPDTMIEVHRRMRWLGSVPLQAIRRADGQPRGADHQEVDPTTVKVIGCFSLVLGLLCLWVSVYVIISLL
jgi:hypothetical protein